MAAPLGTSMWSSWRLERSRSWAGGRALARPAVGSLGLLAVIAIWHVVATVGIVRSGLVPTPGVVALQIVELFRTGEAQQALLASTTRVVLGVIFGVAAAIPIGLLLGSFSWLRAMFEPLLNFFRALPPIALIPLIIVYLGIGENARVFVLTWSSFFVSVIVIYEGTVALDPLYVRAAQVLGANQIEVLTKVLFPLTVPLVLVAVRLSIAVSWGTLVASELLAAQTGIGAMMSDAANFFQIPKIYSGIVLIGIMALVMDRVGRAAMLRFVHWQDRIER